jgi:hypothetical protein
MQEGGLRNCHRSCGPSAQLQVVLRATHRFLWFTSLRQCYLLRWSTNLSECSISIKERSDDFRVDDLTKLEELREVAVIQSTKHQQAMRRYHMWNVSSHSFQVGDFVLWKIQMTKDRHKLSPTWEGPYEVVQVTWSGSYRLQWEDGSDVSNFWNDNQLRPFYM